jgi:hypothetical protein
LLAPANPLPVPPAPVLVIPPDAALPPVAIEAPPAELAAPPVSPPGLFEVALEHEGKSGIGLRELPLASVVALLLGAGLPDRESEHWLEQAAANSPPPHTATESHAHNLMC